jgi:hypothetical protein
MCRGGAAKTSNAHDPAAFDHVTAADNRTNTFNTTRDHRLRERVGLDEQTPLAQERITAQPFASANLNNGGGPGRGNPIRRVDQAPSAMP